MKVVFIVVCLFYLLIFQCSDDADFQESDFIELTGDIVEDMELFSNKDYLLTGQVFVKDGVTLKINPGTVIKAMPYDKNGLAPALIIERGGYIIAEGTSELPITFTSALSSSHLPSRGLWGGIILLGKAPVNTGSESFVEGLSGKPYGGNIAEDSSGILKYVRVWYGGREIGGGNEINGITFAGVGSKTVVEYCEVAWNNDDGFEFFGGTVNVKYLSAIFCRDDCFDTDLGYQGKGQFLFALLGTDECGRAFEMDNNGSDMDIQPRSYPVFYNATLIGPGGGEPAGDGSDQMIRLREGTGGDFRGIIIANGNGVGLRISDDVTMNLIIQNEPTGDNKNSLYFSQNNIIYQCQKGALHGDNIDQLQVSEENPMLVSIDEINHHFDPRPKSGSPVIQVEEVNYSDNFFKSVNYQGAFSEETLWLRGWSWLDEAGYLVR